MKKEKKPRVSSVIIIVLLVLLAISTARAVSELAGYDRRYYDTAQLNYMIRESDYSGMTYDYYNSTESVNGEDKGHQSHWAVMRYFNDAVMHKAYLEHGDAERAALYEERMLDDRASMGQFLAEAEVIDGMLAAGR